MRFAPVRFAIVRFAPLRFVPVRFAPVRFEIVRFAAPRSASLRFAPPSLALLRFGLYVQMLRSPLIPGSDSLFQDCQMFFIRHRLSPAALREASIIHQALAF